MSPSPKRRRRSFEYSPLQCNSFRLLELLPGQSLRADIHCRLRDYQLDSAPPYEALSYTWGDGESTCRISLNGLSFYIRPNVQDMLRRLRQPRSARIIWIDAICIDQNNTNEKSVQVPLMRKIYTKAERVVAWLGEETSDSGMALDFIPYLTKVAKLDEESTWLSHVEDDGFIRQMESLFRLFHRSWWTRTWIIQEVALAPDVLFLCGSRHISWLAFHSLAMAWVDTGHIPFTRFKKGQKAMFRLLGMLISGFSWPLMKLRMEYHYQARSYTPKSFPLPFLLWGFKNRSVTDPRDKIYGLLGLLGDHGVQVNYNRPPEEIYVLAFAAFLSADKCLNCFCWMTGECFESKNLCLPSWVPDFGPRYLKPISSFIPNEDLRKLQPGSFEAGLDRSRSLFAIRFKNNFRTLTLRGHLFDVVSQCGRIYPDMDGIHLFGCANRLILSQWKEMAMVAQSDTYYSRIARENAFWRTILTDRRIEGLHSQENAGWGPSERIPKDVQYIPSENANEEEELFQGMEYQQICMHGRRFCITRKGHFCLLPPTASDGDLICVLLGGEVPYVLRHVDNGSQDSYTMVGECFVHGIMDGEAIADILDGKKEADVFNLC